MSAYIILGAGTFAMDVTEMLVECGHAVVGYVVNRGDIKNASRLLDRPVYDTRDTQNWPDEGWMRFPFLPAIISPERAGLEAEMMSLWFKMGDPFVHRSASVASSANLHPGAVISRQVAVACYTEIKACCIINRSASIGHHNVIGVDVTIGPGAILCGRVKVDDQAVIGAGAIVLEDREIGACARVGAGAVVTRNVPPNTTVLGIPAKQRASTIHDDMPATDW